VREFLEHTRGFFLFSTASSHVGDEHFQAAHRKEGHGCTFHALSTTYSARVRPPTRRRCATRAGRRRAIQSRWPRSSCRHEVHRNLCQIVSIGSRTYRYLPKRWGTTEWEKEVNPVLHSKPRCSGLGVLGRKLVCASFACAWPVNDAEPNNMEQTYEHVCWCSRKISNSRILRHSRAQTLACMQCLVFDLGSARSHQWTLRRLRMPVQNARNNEGDFKSVNAKRTCL